MITIDKAIRRLRSYLRARKPDPDDNFHEAVALGMEALKQAKKYRELKVGFYADLLPGETKEGET